MDHGAVSADGSRDLLLRIGPAGFARALREQRNVAMTDTTFRDAYQSPPAKHVRTKDLVAVAGHVARLTPQPWWVEAWGGATFDVALRSCRRIREPLAASRAAMPNLCLLPPAVCADHCTGSGYGRLVM